MFLIVPSKLGQRGIPKGMETMLKERERAPNEIAYRKLKPEIDRTYPKGRFVAFHNQKIVADATTFDELLAKVTTQGVNPKEGLVVQAGFDYPAHRP